MLGTQNGTRTVRRLATLALALGICVGLTLAAYAAGRWFVEAMFTPIPASALNPPIYPHADDVKIDDQGNGSKIITFQTIDSADSVLAFYRKMLVKDGWVNPLIDDGYPPNIFEWHQGGPDGPTDTAFQLRIDTENVDQGKTQVQMKLIKFDPRYDSPGH